MPVVFKGLQDTVIHGDYWLDVHDEMHSISIMAIYFCINDLMIVMKKQNMIDPQTNHDSLMYWVDFMYYSKLCNQHCKLCLLPDG